MLYVSKSTMALRISARHLLLRHKQWRNPVLTNRAAAAAASWRSLGTAANDVNIIRSDRPDVDIPRQHFFNFVWEESVRNHGDKTALACV